MTGSGKSTFAKRLSQKYGFQYVSGGDALKALAFEVGYEKGGEDWWETNEGKRFLHQRLRDPEFDKKVDEKLMELSQERDTILDSWTMPWLIPKGFKIWLKASPENRALRLIERDNIDLNRAIEALKERDEKTKLIYQRLYGFALGEDFSPFNLILDTNDLTADEVFRILDMTIECYYLNNPERDART
jgi:cytidylate kinase